MKTEHGTTSATPQELLSKAQSWTSQPPTQNQTGQSQTSTPKPQPASTSASPATNPSPNPAVSTFASRVPMTSAPTTHPGIDKNKRMSRMQAWRQSRMIQNTQLTAILESKIAYQFDLTSVRGFSPREDNCSY